MLSSLFFVAGLVGLAYHATEVNPRSPLHYGLVWVLVLRLLAMVAGVFMFRGANWARWLALAWISYFVIAGAWQSWSATVSHAVLLAATAYVLLRPDASAYFRGGSPPP